MRLTQEEVEKRKAQLDSCPLNVFEHLSDLKSFFVEVCEKLNNSNQSGII